MHVKRVELSNFKSFGGTTDVPLLPGFTVISGPNGSGKSNILDSLLFCLGLASSRGMRAERLPDLVNQNQAKRRSTVETIVTATFDISDVADRLISKDDEAKNATLGPLEAGSIIESDTAGDFQPLESSAELPEEHLRLDAITAPGATNGTANGANGAAKDSHNGHSNGNGNGQVAPPQEWKVTRRLRVTAQGTYTSNYYINGEPCTLNDLHEQLQRFRIYPEGYNVVLQGDVTSIISMNARERREIIDEMAGVASFDRKINQAKSKLDVVKEREERFRIVETELIAQLERLDQDRKKAEKYKQIKATLQEKQQWEGVMQWRSRQKQAEQLASQIAKGHQEGESIEQKIAALTEKMEATAAELALLNAKVKALGEEEYLALQSQLATQEAELRQLVRQSDSLGTSTSDISAQIAATQAAMQDQETELTTVGQRLRTVRDQELAQIKADRDSAIAQLEAKRSETNAIADKSQAWVQQQSDLRRQLESLLDQLEPQRAEQVRLQERISRLETQREGQQEALTALENEASATLSLRLCGEDKNKDGANASTDGLSEAEAQIQRLAQKVAEVEADLQTQTQTLNRLLQEQREKQRALDKLEAQEQAIKESQGTQATEVLKRSGIQGLCGIVAELGQVDAAYQLALEIAAGGRMGFMVVEDDRVGARAIDLLKQRRAGRATFLPLNKIRVPNFKPLDKWNRPDGFVDYAVNLISCDDKYADVFAFVFGSTVVFETLAAARQNMGRYRIVTLDGEILESSGAMTGGSLRSRGRLHFGTVSAGESKEAQALRDRLAEIDNILIRCEQKVNQLTLQAKEKSKALIEARQQYRENQLKADQVENQRRAIAQRIAKAKAQLERSDSEHKQANARLDQLAQTLPLQEQALAEKRQAIAALENSQTHSQWQAAQGAVRSLEAQLNEQQQRLSAAEKQQQDLLTQQQRLQEKLQSGRDKIVAARIQQQAQINQQSDIAQQQQLLQETIAQTKSAIAILEDKLKQEKTARDTVERQYKIEQNEQQQNHWQLQKLQETQTLRQQQLHDLQQTIEQQALELPNPLPEIPEDLTLEALNKSLKSLQRRLEALEPVNMLALEEYERTLERLEELTAKLTTLEEERTELLLRIENFTTLRKQAFKEAFDAVNINFQSIFAELSDGDGHLQLDDAVNPFNGGLTLVAHPKGKQVRRLASMSGGEKSLTALSFIFALQRYRPSPFYAFDEVDMFLDGANVERLSKMIQQQAKLAQFIVVSLRRPMIESAERTIGVTQARGAYTQVLGINLAKAT
ncbi:chromosome segregation protein SMC [cf. Phormidesmis sp. LEGE 11477]|uniref:chromosome segregation protein SMC n=1 Tax=cf. Phormidesmis sp. LEGE 11477 TaxID=1828680 RepID=UPI001881B063|nr:chromosome segregation protein SMC [cf. Phormidesmis sp. LEGE 11477]